MSEMNSFLRYLFILNIIYYWYSQLDRGMSQWSYIVLDLCLSIFRNFLMINQETIIK
jgi:hypothetical protein